MCGFLKLHLGVTSCEDGGVSYGELGNAQWKAEMTPCIGGYGAPTGDSRSTISNDGFIWQGQVSPVGLVGQNHSVSGLFSALPRLQYHLPCHLVDWLLVRLVHLGKDVTPPL